MSALSEDMPAVSIIARVCTMKMEISVDEADACDLCFPVPPAPSSLIVPALALALLFAGLAALCSFIFLFHFFNLIEV